MLQYKPGLFFHRLILLLMPGILLSFSGFSADQIYLKNGDIITGKILEKVDQLIKIKTKYAGELTVDWNKVDKITLEKNTAITLADGTRVKAQIIQSNGVTELKLADGRSIAYSSSNIQRIGSPKKTEKKPDAKKYKYEGQVKLAADASSGNTSTRHLSLNSELVIKNELNRFTLGLNSNRAIEGDVDILSNSRAAFKYDRFVSKQFYWYLQNSYYEDKFKDLDLQITLGFGMGRQFWDEEKRKLSLEFGLTKVEEDYNNIPDNDYGAVRWSLRYERYIRDSKIKTFHRHDGLIDLKETDNVTVTSQTGISIPINSHLDTAFQINVDWDAEPSTNRESTDLIYLFSLGYRWKKH